MWSLESEEEIARSSTLRNYSTGVEMGTWEVEIMTITDAACCYLTNICLQFSVLSGISFAVNLERFPCHCCGRRQHSPFIPIPMLLVSVPNISTLDHAMCTLCFNAPHLIPWMTGGSFPISIMDLNYVNYENECKISKIVLLRCILLFLQTEDTQLCICSPVCIW